MVGGFLSLPPPPSEWCRAGGRPYRAVLSASPPSGDECGEPRALHMSGAQGTAQVSPALLVGSHRRQQVRSGLWGPWEEPVRNQDERVPRSG